MAPRSAPAHPALVIGLLAIGGWVGFASIAAAAPRSPASPSATGPARSATSPRVAVDPPLRDRPDDDDDDDDVPLRAEERFGNSGLAMWPSLRVGVGQGLAGHGPDGRPAAGALSLHVDLGAAIHVRGRRDIDQLSFVYQPEAGYARDGRPDGARHRFAYGVAAGLGTPTASVRYRFRMLTGRSGGRTTFGLRHGGQLDFVSGLLGFEVFVERAYRGPPVHTVGLMLSTNLMTWLYAVAPPVRAKW
ncbi:MAG: hypothetical protein K0V04_36380 [Deltaproteobacteria bacterium]|nr:hypothetical protein [Deltaproteobacteria bacterium]